MRGRTLASPRFLVPPVWPSQRAGQPFVLRSILRGAAHFYYHYWWDDGKTELSAKHGKLTTTRQW